MKWMSRQSGQASGCLRCSHLAGLVQPPWISGRPVLSVQYPFPFIKLKLVCFLFQKGPV